MPNDRIDRIEAAVEANTRAIAESNAEWKARINDLERVMRQGFATLTELHVESQHTQQRLDNALAHLAEVMAGHEQRIQGLEKP